MEIVAEEVRERIATTLRSVVGEMTAGSQIIEVSYIQGDKTTIYKISLPQEYRGKLIGAGGRNISSLRQILTAMSANHGFRAIIDLVV
jgi:predicted RNA-binding protein YlqC (UPF0109 family)